MKKYTFVFVVSYIVLAGALAVIADLIKLKGGAVFGIAPMLAASFIAAWRFIRDHEREPTPEEKRSYSWQALVGVWLVSVLAALLFFTVVSSPAAIKPLISLMATRSFLLFFTAGAIFISLICYITIRLSFAWYATLALKNGRGG